MGNLLGTPITDKETHVGITVDEMTSSSSPDGGGLQFGISSMQGWRVHMEDAHIAQPFLFAERPVVSDVNDDNDDREEEKEEVDGKSRKTRTRKTSYERIPLPNHALFAVFDGHGGKFAAEYASLNLLRVLCRSSTFVEYAEKWSGRKGHLAKVREGLISASSTKRSSTSTMTSEESKGVGFGATTSGGDGGENNDATSRNVPPTTTSTQGGEEDAAEKSDRLRLQQLKKRGHDSDEKVRAIKEQVRRHFAADPVFDGDDIDDMEQNSKYQYAQATYDRELMVLLERSLRDAFLDLDAEILGEVRGDRRVEDANVPYALGHHHSDFHSSSSPTMGGGKDAVAMNGDGGGGKKDHTAAVIDHPVPSDDEDAGTTAVVVMTTPRWIVCANAGDSRAVYSSSHRAVPLSYDHKPEDEDEERRIREAGGYVSGGRVEGDLAVSRGLGDYRFKELDVVVTGSRGEAEGGGRWTTVRQLKQGRGGAEEESDDDRDVLMLRPSEQKVSPLPDIIVQNRDPNEDEFIVIACDGIWDVQTNQECVRMVADIFAEGESDLGLVCEEVLDLCLIKGSKDNMTAAVIKFPKQTIGKGGGVQARRERRDGAGGGGASSRNGGGGGRKDNNNDEQQQAALRRVHNPYVPPHSQREGGQQTQGGKGGVDDDDEGR